MRRFTIKGRDYKLTERQYEQLLQRFDVGNAEDYFDEKIIRVDCICSEASAQKCPSCPLGPRPSNCIQLMTAVTEIRKPFGLDFNVTWIGWPKSSKRAEEYITKVRNYLLAIPKTT